MTTTMNRKAKKTRTRIERGASPPRREVWGGDDTLGYEGWLGNLVRPSFNPP